MGFVLARCLLVGGDIVRRERQKCSSSDLSNSHIGVGKEVVELVHEVLRYQVGTANLVEGVCQDGHVYFLQGDE